MPGSVEDSLHVHQHSRLLCCNPGSKGNGIILVPKQIRNMSERLKKNDMLYIKQWVDCVMENMGTFSDLFLVSIPLGQKQ